MKVLADFFKNWRGDVWEFDLPKFCLSEATCAGDKAPRQHQPTAAVLEACTACAQPV